MGTLSEKIAITIGVTAVAGTVLGAVIVSAVNQNSTNSDSGSAYALQADAERTVEETRVESIAYETREVEDSSLEYGKTEVKSAGEEGEKTYTYKVTYKGNEELSRVLVSEEVTKEPVARVIAKGTKILWHCVDVTSYNKNANDDNLCTSSTGERRYVGDCEAKRLEPGYVDSGRGNPYYNPC